MNSQAAFKFISFANRPFLSQVVSAMFRRGTQTISFKFGFEREFIPFENILKNNFHVHAVADRRMAPRGISGSKKKEIITKLLPHMPPHHRHTWINMPESADSADLLSRVH